jgi:hypothetical protein
VVAACVCMHGTWMKCLSLIVLRNARHAAAFQRAKPGKSTLTIYTLLYSVARIPSRAHPQAPCDRTAWAAARRLSSSACASMSMSDALSRVDGTTATWKNSRQIDQTDS